MARSSSFEIAGLRAVSLSGVLLGLVGGPGCTWTFPGNVPDGGAGGPGSGGSNGGNNPGGAPPGGLLPNEEWTNATANLAGMDSECGNLTLVASRPDQDMLIAGVAQKGLWASTNGATDWTRLGQGAGSAQISNRPMVILFDPMSPDTFWEAGIYNRGGVYRTNDNGVTFAQLGEVTHCDMVGVDFADPERKTLLAGGHEQEGKVNRSSDGGKTWVDIGARVPAGAGYSANPYVVDGNTHLLGTYGAAGAGVFRSTDGGMTWAKVHAGGVRGRPLAASDGALYWVLDSDGGLVRSADAGATWTRLGTNMISTRYGSSLIELPDGRLASLGEHFLVISANKGGSWRTLGARLPMVSAGFVGVIYSRFRKAFYAWHFTCGLDSVPVPANAIMRLAFDHQTQ
jgi:photosystem II stability/assembly factor-like uncharacterized protein